MTKLTFSTALLSVFTTLTLSSHAQACDTLLQGTRDCKIQDRYRAVRDDFKARGINVNDIAEYRAIRLIARADWEKAKAAQEAPKDVYQPAPDVWNIWSWGVDRVSSSNIDLKNVTADVLSQMNINLMSDGKTTLQDAVNNDTSHPLGHIRQGEEWPIHLCSYEPGDNRAMSDRSVKSLETLQATIEKKLKTTFQKIVASEHGMDDGIATMAVGPRMVMPVGGHCDTYHENEKGYSITLVSSQVVPSNLDWMRIFLKTMMKQYEAKNLVLTPVQLGALMQKWFVTVHAFEDGNGRTSRALQDLILEKFDLPYAPGGDLQNDILAEFNEYVELNYTKTEAMLSKLESCLAQVKAGGAISFECKTTAALNN